MKKWLISLLTAWFLFPGLFGLSASPDTQLTKLNTASPHAESIAVFEEYVPDRWNWTKLQVSL